MGSGAFPRTGNSGGEGELDGSGSRCRRRRWIPSARALGNPIDELLHPDEESPAEGGKSEQGQARRVCEATRKAGRDRLSRATKSRRWWLVPVDVAAGVGSWGGRIFRGGTEAGIRKEVLGVGVAGDTSSLVAEVGASPAMGRRGNAGGENEIRRHAARGVAPPRLIPCGPLLLGSKQGSIKRKRPGRSRAWKGISLRAEA